MLTPQAKQPFELNADSVEILGDCPADEYPLQKKKMSMEYLRTMPTLRHRTNTFNAAFRVRSVAAYAIHKFFQENGFVYAHSPLLTASDCEGAGEMFRVTTLDLDNVPKNEDGTSAIGSVQPMAGTTSLLTSAMMRSRLLFSNIIYIAFI